MFKRPVTRPLVREEYEFAREWERRLKKDLYATCAGKRFSPIEPIRFSYRNAGKISSFNVFGFLFFFVVHSDENNVMEGDSDSDPFDDPIYEETCVHERTRVDKYPVKQPRMPKIKRWKEYNKIFEENGWDPTSPTFIDFRILFGVLPTVIQALCKKLGKITTGYDTGDLLLMTLCKLKRYRLIDIKFHFGGGRSTISEALKKAFVAICTLDFVFTKAFPSNAECEEIMAKLRELGLPNPEAPYVGDAGTFLAEKQPFLSTANSYPSLSDL